MAMENVPTDPARACYYRLREGTRQEYVAVGSTGRLVRWEYKDEPQQIWLLLPYDLYGGQPRYTIMTKQNGEYMSVKPEGYVVRWEYSDDRNSQIFMPETPENLWYVFREFTRNECVDVPNNGDLKRWELNGGANQKYQLVALDAPSKPDLNTGKYAPDQIPFPPQLTSVTDVPVQTTDPCLIGETALPCTIVDDSQSYPSKIAQMDGCPYYILSREQYWKRTEPAGFYYSHNSVNSVTKTFEITVGLSETESQTMEQMVGMVLSSSMEVGFRKGAVTIGTQVAGALHLTQYQSVTWMGSRTVTEQYTFAQPMAYVYWALVDHFKLMRGNDRSIVQQWQVLRMDVHVSNSYPVSPQRDSTVVRPVGVQGKQEGSKDHRR